jgi:Ser/Thr protein kinase RdoA (MazF antagonist)
MEPAITEAQISEVLKSFGIPKIGAVTWVNRNVWDIGDRFILKQCPELNEFNKSLWFSNFLTEKNIPVRHYLKTTDGGYLTDYNGISYCLMSKIIGSHIDPYSGNSYETGRKLGRIVAALHQALHEAEPPFKLLDSDCIFDLGGWIAGEIKDKNIPVGDDIVKACLDSAPLYKKLPRQIIHRDMHLQNLVFEGDDFSGYLDFDICQKNARIFDLCYLGSSMLVGNYNKEKRFGIWQNIFYGVLCGYDEHLHLSDDEKAIIPLLMIMIELIFTAWYSRQGQPELVQNCTDMAQWCYEHIGLIQQILERLR